MIRSATFSECRKYRHTLTRSWSEDVAMPFGAFIGKNPSDADAEKDDPTVGKWVAFSRSWGWRGFLVVNMADYIATDADELMRLPDSLWCSERNLIHNLITVLKDNRCCPVVCCWGTHVNRSLRERLRNRGDMIRRKLTEAGIEPMCFKKNNDGTPAHPLYLPMTTELKAY